MKTALDSTPLRLKEVPIEGTIYSELVPLDPGQYLTIPERVAIAHRIQELDGKLPRYVVTNRRFVPKPGAAVQPEGEAMETPPEKKNDEKKPAEKPASSFHSRNDPKNSGHAATLAADAEAAAKQSKKPAVAQPTKGTAAVKKPATTAPKKPAAPKKPSAHVAGISGKLEKFAGYPLTAKMTALKKDHDFVKGSIREQIFLKLLRATTVGEAKKVSSDPWHLRTAVKMRRIKVG